MKDLFLKIHKDLLEGNVAFLHSAERIEKLRQKGLGLHFKPPHFIFDGYVKEAIPACLNPPVIASEEIKEFEKLAEAWGKFRKAARTIYRQSLNGELPAYVCDLIGTRNEKENFGIHPGYCDPMPLLRLDMLKSSDGWKILDTNSSRPAGVGWCGQSSKILQAALSCGKIFPVFDSARAVIFKTYFKWTEYFGKHKKENPYIAVVIEENQGTSLSYYALAALFKEKRDRCEIVFDKEMQFDGANLKDKKGNIIDIVIRGCKPDLGKGGELIAKTYPKAACVTPPLYRRCLGHKAWMFLLQIPEIKDEFEKLLGNEILKVLINSLPKTYLIQNGKIKKPNGEEINFEEINRNCWTLKASTGSSSRGIFIGKTLTRKKWLELLKSAGEQKGIWILQEFIEPPRISLKILGQSGEIEDVPNFKSETAIYIHGGKFAGLHLMATQISYKIHGGIGTIFVPYFEKI